MGTLSWTLTILALNGLLMAGLLATTRQNQMANRFLAALVGLISLRLGIYILGFAGAYDNYPWITFAPLDMSLAFGPLLWIYMESLTHGSPPQRWVLHLVPPAVQLCYYCIAFALPLDLKLRWFGGPHLDWIAPIGLLLVLTSCVAYLSLSWRRQREYQRWLDDFYSNRERWRLGWMSLILGAFAVTVLAAIIAAVINLTVAPVGYFGRTPVIVASSLSAYVLGLLGWHHSGLDLPPQPRLDTVTSLPESKPSRPAIAFSEWGSRIAQEGWWKEEGLTLAQAAHRLGTSERTLSRALSEGPGCNFNTFINGLRVKAVIDQIESGPVGDLLSVALDCGFSSKASFNRAFLRHTGTTPSRWRTSASQISPIDSSGAT